MRKRRPLLKRRKDDKLRDFPVFISILALVVLVVGVVRNEIRNKLAEKQLANLQKQEAKEGRAEVSVDIEQTRFGLFYVINNAGPGLASQIRLHVETGAEFTGDPLFQHDKDKLPISKLEPRESTRIRARASGDTGRNFEATVVWRNQNGTERTMKKDFYV